jgi:deoxyribose-phosphate aldolase
LNIECSEEIQAIEVVDITGRVIITENNLSTLTIQLATDWLAEATYIIHIKTATGKTAVKSFVKQ